MRRVKQLQQICFLSHISPAVSEDFCIISIVLFLCYIRIFPDVSTSCFSNSIHCFKNFVVCTTIFFRCIENCIIMRNELSICIKLIYWNIKFRKPGFLNRIVIVIIIIFFYPIITIRIMCFRS